MDNPYRILGLNSNATDEQVKAAYRELLARYQSDGMGDPLSDVADSRIQLINEAYDQIMAERRVGNVSSNTGAGTEQSPYNNRQYGGSYSQSQNYSTVNYSSVRSMINSGDIDGAERILTTVDSSQRGAEWNYLMGCISQQRGWLDQCYRYYANAHSMEPSNSEYAQAFSRVSAQRSGRTTYSPYGNVQMIDPCTGRTISTSSTSGSDPISTACQCMCLYSLCNSCCCGGR